MNKRTVPGNKGVPAASGLRPHLKDKSTSRRTRERALTRLEGLADRRNDLLPTLQMRAVSLDEITPAHRRIRRATAVQAKRLDASIARFGICAPILIDESGRIIDGHMTFAAAKRAGLATIPAIEITHLSEAERRALAIALNRLAETGSWDEDALKLEFEELIDLGMDELEVTGFDLEEIDHLLLDQFEEPDEDDIAAAPAPAVSRPGDLWLLGKHRLLQGNSLDPLSYARLLEDDAEIRLVLTDPPYNVATAGHITSKDHHREFAMAHGEMDRETFTAFLSQWMKHCEELLVDGGLLIIFMDWRHVDQLLKAGRDLALKLLNMIVWAKSNGGQGSLWRSQHELAPVFKKGNAGHVNNVQLGAKGRDRTNLWTYAGASSLGSDSRHGLALHPTVKPRLMLEDAILDVTERGDIVLDPFLGSGSTLLAAETTGRVCRGIEIDGPYCDVVISRWEVLTKEQAKLAQTGETFREVMDRRAAELSSVGKAS